MIYFAAYVGLSLLIGAIASKADIVQTAKGRKTWPWVWWSESRWDALLYALLVAAVWPVVGAGLACYAVGAAVCGLLSRTSSRTLAWMNEDPVALERHRMRRKALKAAASSHEEDDEGCCGGALLGCIMAFAASFLTVIACIEGTRFVAWLWRTL